MPVAAHDLHIHRIFDQLGAGKEVSQRSLARELGIALGLTNLLVSRMVHKGWVRLVRVPPNRFRYLLTPAGLAEKARMSRDYLANSLRSYIQTRDRIRRAFAATSASWNDTGATGDRKDIVFFGGGEVAEIGYICLQETDLKLVGVIVMSLSDGAEIAALLQARGVPPDRVTVAELTLRRGSVWLIAVLVGAFLVPGVGDAIRNNVTNVRVLKQFFGSRDAQRVDGDSPAATWLNGLQDFEAGKDASAMDVWGRHGRAAAERLGIAAQHWRSEGREEDAIRALRAAMWLQPENPDYVGAYANVLLARQDRTTLARDLDLVLARVPSNAAAVAFRAWCVYLAGDAAGARALFDRSIAVDPEDVAALQYFARFLRETEGRSPQVEALLLRGDRRWGDAAVFHYELAKLYTEQGRLNEARPYADRVLVNRPQDPYAREFLASYEVLQQRYVVALEHARVAVTAMPGDSRFWLGLGDTLRAMGNEAEAVDAFRRAAAMGDARAVDRLTRSVVERTR